MWQCEDGASARKCPVGVEAETYEQMLWVYSKMRMLHKALCTKDSPKQMAAGLACGLLLGLLPKGNLVAVAVASMLMATRMSLAVGILCAFAVSLVAPLCDPLTHRIGQEVLTTGALAPLWRHVSRIPLAAWTSFNNTVVMGSLSLGLLLVWPVYRLSLPWMVRLQSRYAEPQQDANAEGQLPDSAVPESIIDVMTAPTEGNHSRQDKGRRVA